MLHAASSRPSYTIEEFEHIAEADDGRVELVGGLLVREPPTGAGHGRAQTLLARHLDAFAEQHHLGIVLTDVAVVIDATGPTVRGPDLSFIARGRLVGPLPEGSLHVVPDLIVEVVSPSNSVPEIQQKVLEYLAAGCGLVWVVDPRSRTATVYRSRHDVEIIAEDEMLEGGDVLPGLRLPLRSVLP